MPKKRHRESPFNPELVAAITKGLPAILAKEGYFKNSTPEEKPNSTTEPEPIQSGTTQKNRIRPLPKQEQRTLPTPVPRGNTNVLWYSVAIFGLAIIAIWGFNMRSIVNSVWSEKTGQEIVSQSKDDFSAILETIKKNDKIAKEQIRSATIIPATAPTSTSTSTNQTNLDTLVEAIKAKENP